MSSRMVLRARVAAPIDEVRRALTTADALRAWLGAEHATVDLPDTYAFWGRYTPDGDAPHQRPLHVDEHTLRFGWLVDGVDTVVEIGLEADGPRSTIVSLSQTGVPDWAEAMAGCGARGLLYTFWALAISNLVDHLLGREPIPMPDLTSPELRAQILIAAPRPEVADSLLDPEKFRRWFGANIEIEPYVGGRWAMGGFESPGGSARIIELEPDRRVALDWGNLVETWELEDSDGQTRLTFVRSGFDRTDPPYGGWLGWLGGLGELRRFHELPDWRQTWLAGEMPGTPDGIVAIG